jgi:hypothetical protein
MMKRRTSVTAGLLLTLGTLAAAETIGPRTATADSPRGGGTPHGFEHFLRRYEAANTAFQNGDPAPWLAITAENDPVSIFGGFGGLGEAGTAIVHQRYLLAAGAFQPSGAEVDFEYLVKDVRGPLAYTVAIERSTVRYTGQAQPHRQILRVTMLFRLVNRGWRIVHRHADTMIDLELPMPDPRP